MIYFLDCPAVNRIKIGKGDDPETRIASVRLMCPVETTLLGVIPGGFTEEATLHRRFAPLRRYGEWFEGTPELRQAIQEEFLMAAWNAAGPDARAEFLARVRP